MRIFLYSRVTSDAREWLFPTHLSTVDSHVLSFRTWFQQRNCILSTALAIEIYRYAVNDDIISDLIIQTILICSPSLCANCLECWLEWRYHTVNILKLFFNYTLCWFLVVWFSKFLHIVKPNNVLCSVLLKSTNNAFAVYLIPQPIIKAQCRLIWQIFLCVLISGDTVCILEKILF